MATPELPAAELPAAELPAAELSAAELPAAPRPSKQAGRQLRLYVAGEESSSADGQLSASMTLGEFFAAYVAPICQATADPLTVKEKRCSLAYWALATGDPSLETLDACPDGYIAAFVAHLAAARPKGKPLADNTRRKHVGAIQFVLDLAGPRTRRDNPRGAGLIDDPPAIERPPLYVPEGADAYTLEEIGRFLEACRAAQRPRLPGISAAEWWRSLVLFAYNVGFRLETILAARKDWLVEEEGRRWWLVPREGVKGGRAKKLYCNAHAWRIVQRLAHLPGPSLFAWPYRDSWLQAQRRAILAASTLPPRRRRGFHALREALGTELSAINPMAASLQLGHALSGGAKVTRDHYAHRRLIAPHLEALPQPVWSDADDSQLRLF